MIDDRDMMVASKKQYHAMMHQCNVRPPGMHELIGSRHGYTVIEVMCYLILHNNYVLFEKSDGTTTMATQKDGMAMGQPPVAPLSNILLASYELEDNTYDVCVRYARRLIDDICWTAGKVKTMYPEYVKFNLSTVEKDGFLTFLDTEINLTKYEVRMHYKPFHRPFTEWSSNVPRAFIANTITTECMRAKRICTTEGHFNDAVVYLKSKAKEANIPDNVIEAKCSAVKWSDREVMQCYDDARTNSQLMRHSDMRSAHQERWRSRQSGARKMLEKGTVVSIQHVYTKMDLNVSRVFAARFVEIESTTSVGLYHNLNGEFAEKIARQLCALKFTRARKPTPSIRAIARRVVNGYLEARRLCNQYDISGTQWRQQQHELSVRGIVKELIKDCLWKKPLSTLSLLLKPPKAEEGCKEKTAESTTRNAKGKG
jgi:hypothetical protein